MRNNIEEKNYSLSSYEDNGLIVDVDKAEALSFLSSLNGDINQYISRYALLSSSGKLIFVPGTTFTAVKKDILFDLELERVVVSNGALLLVEMERRILSFNENYFTRMEGTLEDIWFDYNTNFPSALKKSLSSSFGLDCITFSDELEMISYAVERAKEGRKLIDHVFLDSPSISFPLIRSNMIAAAIYMNEGLLNYISPEVKNTSFNTLLTLLDRYGMEGERIGLTY